MFFICSWPRFYPGCCLFSRVWLGTTLSIQLRIASCGAKFKNNKNTIETASNIEFSKFRTTS